MRWIVLAVSLAVSLAACGGEEAADPLAEDATTAVDAGATDALGPDSAPVDEDSGSATPDAAAPDAAAPDSAAPDAAAPDAGNDERPQGWTDETHGKIDANYAVVFPQDKVNRIDFRCAPEAWASMQADLQEITSTDPVNVPDRPSEGGGPGGGPDFDELVQACNLRPEGSDCESSAGPGMCVSDGQVLFCLPEYEGGPPDNWPEFVAACDGLAEEAPCDPPGYNGGLCLPEDVGLVCIPNAWLGGPGGPGGPDGDMDYAAAAFWSRSPAYIPCDVDFDGRTWWQVGLRYKGNSTLAFSTGNTRKLPLRIKFDAFEDDNPALENQRFYGFNHLSTVNHIADTSFLRQKLAADVFRAAGVPSPQTAFYRVYIDHGDGPIYFGLYTVTESPRKPLLKAQFDDSDGTLYECDGRGAQFEEFVEASFHRKTNKDSDDYGDVQRFISALNAEIPEGGAETWRAELETTFDVDGFIRFFAVNQAIVNWDTYGGLAHNYYLYGDPSDGGRLKWIPWDFDLSLQDQNSLSMNELEPGWPLLVRLRDDPVYAERYRAALREVIEGPFSPAQILPEVARLRALVEPYVLGEDGEQPKYTVLPNDEAFAESQERLVDHIESRDQAVRAFLSE